MRNIKWDAAQPCWLLRFRSSTEMAFSRPPAGPAGVAPSARPAIAFDRWAQSIHLPRIVRARYGFRGLQAGTSRHLGTRNDSDERCSPDTPAPPRHAADQPCQIRSFRAADRAVRNDGQVVSDGPRGAGGVPRRTPVLP